ncbi:MAG: Thiol:disulfide interchange protein DsbD precursor, partial [Pseudomonadota bacterium]
KIILLLALAILFAKLDNALGSSTSWQNTQNKVVQSKLMISAYQINNEKKLIGAIHFKINEGWKLYGADSQSVGLPPSITISEFDNYISHQIVWPKAELAEEKIGKEVIKYNYYKNEVIIPFEISTKQINLQNKIKTKLSYAYCKEVCIPADQEFSLDFSDQIDNETLSKIQKYYPQSLGIEDNINKSSNDNQQQPTKNNKKSLLVIIIFGIIGGFILNIMPCVLPVLSIKLMSVINHSNASPQKIKFAFLATFLGIISCFFVFAGLAIIIKAMGDSLGWGLQFQNPYFLIFLVIILIFFIAEFLDIFTINYNQVIATILNQKIVESEKKKNIFVPNFLSGILAVLLATPCSAPFLGSAISFALTQDSLTTFGVFVAIGLGFGSPYIFLIIYPNIVEKLPKPGEWMYRIKQTMAGLLMATIIWLIYILSKNIGTIPAFIIAFLSIAIFAVLSLKGLIKKIILILCLSFLSFTLPFEYQEQQNYQRSEFDRLWAQFDESKIEKLVDQNLVVLVDVTADWCITCKFNKIRVLKDQEIIDKLKKHEIIGLRADITKPNKEIMIYMEKYNRYAIPFNIIYGPNAREGILISELLTKEELLQAIDKAK